MILAVGWQVMICDMIVLYHLHLFVDFNVSTCVSCVQFGGNPVSCAIGLAVLEVMRTEKLMTSATNVGRFLKDSLTQLGKTHGCIGEPLTSDQFRPLS